MKSFQGLGIGVFVAFLGHEKGGQDDILNLFGKISQCLFTSSYRKHSSIPSPLFLEALDSLL